MKVGSKFAAATMAFLASGSIAPAVAQDYCASLKKVIATTPRDFSPLFVHPPRAGQHYKVNLPLPGARDCHATPGSTEGRYLTRASYKCEYVASDGNGKAMFDRMLAQTEACFGHSYRRPPHIEPNDAAMTIFSESGALYVKEFGLEDDPGFIASVWVTGRSNGVTVNVSGKKPKRS